MKSNSVVKSNIEKKADPEIKVEVMRKSKFDAIEKRFYYISDKAKDKIKTAKETDFLMLTLSFDNPVSVEDAEITSPDDYLSRIF